MVISDVTQIVAPPNTLRQNYLPGYVGLQQQVDKMVNYQDEISKNLRVQNSKTRKAWRSIKIFWNEKVLGKRCYTLEELFGMQLGNVSALNSNLIGIIKKSRQELQVLEKYQKLLYAEFCNSLGGIDENKETIRDKLKLYLQAQKKMGGIKEKDADYFKCEAAIKNLKRQLMEDMHSYSLTNERILDLSKEKDFLNTAEDLVRISVQTCEKTVSKTLRMERHIAHTMRCYESLRQQQSTMASLESAVATLTDFTMQVHNILSDGLSIMVGMSSNTSENFYEKAGGNLSNFLKEISEANYAKDAEIEGMVKKYMEGEQDELNGLIENKLPHA